MSNNVLNVYVSMIPDDYEIGIVPHKNRFDIINQTHDDKKKMQKAFVWDILGKAIKHTFGLDFNDLDFILQDNGKWVCKDLFFSLSHSNKSVMIGVSNNRVGVDIEEKVARKDYSRLRKKILSNDEIKLYQNSLDSEKMLTLWTKKESIFKMLDLESLSLKKIDTLKVPTYTNKIECNQESYIFSIAADNLNNLHIYKIEYFKNQDCKINPLFE